MTERLPAKLEVMALVRLVGGAGGFASVLHKGEPDGGTILVVLTEKGANTRVFERMPTLEGGRKWHRIRSEESETKQEIDEYLTRRQGQDADLWIVELDIADGERFIGLTD